jgi:hypothetical protein
MAALRELHVAAFEGIASLTSRPGEMEWCSGDFHFTKWEDGAAIAHVGVVIREGIVDSAAVLIGGISDVGTRASHRSRGLASTALALASELMVNQGVDFGLLVCRPPVIPYYERLGWRAHRGDVYSSRFGERVLYQLSTVMVLPFKTEPAADAEIDLCGPAW